MTDPRRPDSAAPGPDAPPPSPWWSRPEGEDQWGTPARDAQQPAYGSPTDAYGAYGGQPAPTVTPDDPWSRPTTQASFPSGAAPWGTPTDTIGAPVTARSGKRGGVGAK